jgi:putative ribosome biogenesis GTPase RsgA
VAIPRRRKGILIIAEKDEEKEEEKKRRKKEKKKKKFCAADLRRFCRINGDSGVGKSSLILRYVEDSFSEDSVATISEEFKVWIALFFYVFLPAD